MILVVGGRGAGKRDYVASLGYRPGDDAACFDLHDLLRDPALDLEALLPGLLAKAVVVCDEIGCGIVPLDPAERAWRDRVGRTCVLLAARAERVVRLCCGIPAVIKDDGRCG